MRALVIGALLVSIVLPAFPAGAAESTDLRAELRRRRLVVQPRPDAAAVRQDAERTAAELAARARREAVIREAIEPGRRRPDLRYEVTSAIQQQNLRNAR